MKIGYRINGKVVSRKEFMRKKRTGGSGAPMMNRAYEKPLKSVSAGCHSTQVAEFNAHLERAGIQGARYSSDGTLEFTSRRARNEVCRLRGLIDQDASYGDAQ
jgi:hypothetical protein